MALLQNYAKHLLFLNDYGTSQFILIFWSIAVEFKFYLLAPVIVFFITQSNRSNPVMALMVLIIFLLVVKSVLATYFLRPANEYVFFMDIRTPFHMAIGGLITGMLCQFLWLHAKTQLLIKKESHANILFWGGLFSLAVLTAFTKPYFYYELSQQYIPAFYKTVYTSLISISFGAMLLGLLGGCCGHGFFEIRLFQGIALVSYSLYLVHAPLVPVIRRHVLDALESDISPSLEWTLVFVVTLLVSLPVATLMYYFIEAPCISWSKKTQYNQPSTAL